MLNVSEGVPENSSVERPLVAAHRVRIDCAYDGSLFSGWAAQPHLVTVQGVLESALELILRSPHRVVVAGRTDAGVHAEAQTVHCDLTEADWDRLKGRTGDDDPAPRWHAACRVLCGVASTTRRNTSAFRKTWPVFCRGRFRCTR